MAVMTKFFFSFGFSRAVGGFCVGLLEHRLFGLIVSPHKLLRPFTHFNLDQNDAQLFYSRSGFSSHFALPSESIRHQIES